MQKRPLLLLSGILLMLVFAFPVSTLHAQTAAGQASGGPASSTIVDTTTVTGEGSSSADQNEAYESAIVTDVKSVTQQTDTGAQQIKTYDVEFLTGSQKGQTKTLSSDISSNPNQIDPAKGDKVLVLLEPDPTTGQTVPYLESFDRSAAVYWLIILFIGTMVLLAGWQGFKISFSIVISVILIGTVLIPAFLHGLDPVPVAMGLVAVLATISAVLSIGWNRKSMVTIIGTIGGVFVAYLISLIFAHWAHLSGLSSEEDRLFFDNNPLLSAQGLLFAGVIIAAMGVVEDVAVSIASGVMEVRQANPRLSFRALFRSGMVVGRDHMGALANTLVFAYVGASLSTLLLYSQYGGSWAKFINFDSVVEEVIRSLAGTIGLIFTVPITALLAAWFALRIKGPKDPIREATGWHGDHQHLH